MAEWRLALSLVALREECNAVAPQRRKTYDGTIGDKAHAARASRHNPEPDEKVVCALDITDDPERGMDCAGLFAFLCLHPHPDLEYIIHDGKVARRSTGFKVETYRGSNPHKTHIHVAVGRGPDRDAEPPYDDRDSWRLNEWKGEDMNADEVRALIREQLDIVNDPDAIDEAQAYLVSKHLLTRPHPAGKAATVGFVTLLFYRFLKYIGK